MKKASLAAVTLTFLLITLGPLQALGQSIFSRWEVGEFQPNIANGGRANTIAVHPSDATKIYIATETGGLFRSTDGGNRWKHVDALPCYRMMGVTYLPANPNIVLVSTIDDMKTVTGGGIWRSTDGGFNWTQVALTLPSWASGRMSAYEISVEPSSGDVYAGSEFGLMKSTDQGASWTFQDPFGGGDRRVFSVVALGGGKVIAGGPSGIRRSDTGGGAWVAPSAYPGAGIWDAHALGRSPVSATQAFVADGNTNLFYTENAGQNWTQITSAPAGGGGCGGITFARAARRTGVVKLIQSLDLYFGNRCGMAKLRIGLNLLGGGFNYSGAWQTINMDHGDTRDLGFDNALNPNPILLGTDGGLHKTSDGGANWTFAGGGNNGYNALQITEVQGQLIDDIDRYDFYFGTQDNNLWSSGTDGASWTSGMCCEGFFIEAQKKVATAADSKITNVTCAGCGNVISDPLFSGVGGWTNPAGDVAGNPMIIARSRHIQGVNNSGGFSKGFAVTNNLGGAWQQWATFPEDRRDIPKLGRVGSKFASTVVYQAYRTPGWYGTGGFEVNHLMRLHKTTTAATATVFYPAMNNFGGLGINPTMFAWYQVFAVDPGNYLHVIAPDVINNRMMETKDGGENWSEIPGLTNLVTDGGRLRFSSGIFPLVSAISFSPQNPNFVTIGTWEGGVYLSIDNGATWRRINNSEGVTNATGFAWKNANDVVISSYGRGLWRLKHTIKIPWPDLELMCKAPCFLRPFDPGILVLPPWDQGVIIFDGRVMGARAANGVIREIFVSNGASVVFIGQNTRDTGITITRTAKEMGFEGFRSQPRAPREASLMKGLLLGGRNEVVGAVYGDKPMAMYEEKEQDDREGNTRSPAAQRPYMQLSIKSVQGGPSALPNEVIRITVTNLERNADLAIFVDDKPAGRVKVSENGTVRAEVNAPMQFGLHSITIRRVNDRNSIVDGTMFFVKHEDKIERRLTRPNLPIIIRRPN